jgi:polysaccharide biosynthesis protein PslH
MTGRPYTWYIHESGEARRRLRQLIGSTAFDVVHVDSLDLIALLPELEGKQVALTHHNVESSLLKRRAERESSTAASAYLRHQAALLGRAERRWLPRVALNIAVSPVDAAEFQRMAPSARVDVIPNGVDTEYFSPGSQSTTGCVFVGGTSWYPNLDGLEWFVADVLPRLHRLGMEREVIWVGRATDSEMAHYNRVPGLRLTGYVPDIRPFVHAAACFIAPLRVGGGTRLKILDAWAMGKAVVSTSRGAEGLLTVDGGNILLADSAEAFATQVIRVLRDDALRARLEAAARKTAVSEYSWDVLGDRMCEMYLALVGGEH